MVLVTKSGANATVFVAATEPTMQEGDIWFDTANGILYYAEDDTPTLRAIEQTTNKNAASGYAGLDANSRLTLSQYMVGVLALG